MGREVAIIVHNGVQALDVAGPLDVFAEAASRLPSSQGYQCLLIARTRDPVRSSNGTAILPDLSFEEAARDFHTVLVAGGPALPEAAADPATSAWLQGDSGFPARRTVTDG